MKELNQHRLLSRKEAAAFLGVKEITLAVWKSSKKHNIPVVKVGRLIRYRFSDLLDFVESRTFSQPKTEQEQSTHTTSSKI